MKNKKAFEMAISTIVLMILGIMVLIGLIIILTSGWGNFKMYIGAIAGSESAQAQKVCKIQCNLENNYDYCCEEKVIKKQAYKCSDKLLKGDCNLDCAAVSCLNENSNLPPFPN